MQTHIIYIPGLGTRLYNRFRAAALAAWVWYGAPATLIPLDWYSGDSLESMKNKVSAAIDQIDPSAHIVVIGESAGATLALWAAHMPNVDRVITICGVTRATMPISAYIQDKSPAFTQAVRSIPVTNGKDVHSVVATKDKVVDKKYSIATGAREYVLWTKGHLFTIIMCLTFLAPLVLTIAKKAKT